MPHYRIDIEYDGTDFFGWQVQPGRRTVQGTLAEILARLDGDRPVRIVGAGRTDAGVHARGQVASFELQRQWMPARLRHALNASLPPDLHVHAAAAVAPGWSARAAALWRRYRYQLLRRPSPIGRRTHHILHRPVDPLAMQEAAGRLVGRHDFRAFARLRPDEPSHCEVLDTRVEFDTRTIVFEIRANRFLHNMVRRLTGALVEVGRGRLQPDDLATILVHQEIQRGGPCLPPQGLLLVEVGYPEAAPPVVDETTSAP